ncbi:ABC transporter ATP-binding protein [Aquipuribacter nitratireducens]|uniref:ABC transporter ATP-binding protein n=1 Tax=Aquipuribacter nitratireducens TaxID=650104 RepID=A0ABW0GJW3_9MICO
MRLELEGITKRFGSFTANDAIDLVVEPGEIHALLGENGAGKSTLMNVLFGLLKADEGRVLVDGDPVRFTGPRDAMQAGIGMVHQHFMLVPVFTVAENVVLGDEPTKGGGFLDRATAAQRVRETSARFGFDLDPDRLVGDLPVGVQQRVEIIKALVRDAEVLILDEPTAVLTPQETDELLGIMKELAASGTSIVFITHKLREVKEVADRITVIRRGKVVGTAEPTASATELASLMVGRAVDLTVDKEDKEAGEVRFSMRGVSLVEDGITLLDDVDLDVRSGEIVAVAGVQGNGQTELTETILGLVRPSSGSITLDGTELSGRSVRQVLDAGVGFVPEDRSTDGVIGSFTVAENLVLDLFHGPPFASGLAYDPKAVLANAEHRIEEFDIRAGGPTSTAGSLSGGNQQKVVLARELSRPLRLFVASQPTRGLDVGSIEFVHSRIVAERDSGAAVLVVSTELDEVVALADRIAVMYAGRVVGVVPADTPREVLGLMMAGMSADEAARARASEGSDAATSTPSTTSSTPSTSGADA